MLIRFLKILLGLALIPFCLGYLWQFFSMLFSITYKPNTPYYFVGGAIAYLVVHILFKKQKGIKKDSAAAGRAALAGREPYRTTTVPGEGNMT